MVSLSVTVTTEQHGDMNIVAPREGCRCLCQPSAGIAAQGKGASLSFSLSPGCSESKLAISFVNVSWGPLANAGDHSHSIPCLLNLQSQQRLASPCYLGASIFLFDCQMVVALCSNAVSAETGASHAGSAVP